MKQRVPALTLSVPEAAERLGFCRAVVWRLLRSEELTAVCSSDAAWRGPGKTKVRVSSYSLLLYAGVPPAEALEVVADVLRRPEVNRKPRRPGNPRPLPSARTPRGIRAPACEG